MSHTNDTPCASTIQQSAPTAEPEVIPANQRNLQEEKKQIDHVNIEGRKIFNDFTNRQKKDKAFAQLDPQSQYEYYLKLYPDFARSSPVILRYITFGMFSEKAVFLYLTRCYERPIKTDEDYCSHQADFVKYLYHCNTKIRGAELDKIWHDTKKLLMDELDEIAKERERIKAERLASQTGNDEVRREALKVAVIRAMADAKAKLSAERAGEKIAEIESKMENMSLATSAGESQPVTGGTSADGDDVD